MRHLLLVLVALILAAPISAWAVDGVLEINQTCAQQRGPTAGDDPGCFAGDTDGLPVTISAPGSYRLTSDLIVPDENTDGIGVSTSDVGIDLNNFAIIRSGCEGATTNCTPAFGSGSGVDVFLSNFYGVSVTNGSITGMGDTGVLLGNQAEVTNLRVRWNRLNGISAGSGSTISGNTAYENGNNGIRAQPGSTISDNTAYENVGQGIVAGIGSTVSGNTAFQNEGGGIFTGESSSVSGNTAYNNGGVGVIGGDGIFAGGGSTVRGNSASNNSGDGIHVEETATNLGGTVSGNTVRGNQGDGIFAGAGSTVSDNAAADNGGDGIHVKGSSMVRGNTAFSNDGYGLNLETSTRSGYTENVVSDNALGTVNPGKQLGENLCDGSTATCP